MKINRQVIDVSTLTFVKIIIILVGISFLLMIKDVIMLIFLALILAAAFDPWVDWLHRRRIHKTVSVLIVYSLFILVILTTVFLVIPPFAKEFTQLVKLFPEYYEKINLFFGKLLTTSSASDASNVQSGLMAVSNNLNEFVGSVFTTTFEVFGGIFSFITVLIMAFYFAMEENAIKKFANSIIPKKHQSYVVDIFSKIQEKLGQWFRGQLILSLIIFCITFLGLSLLRVKYALVLALLAGILEIVPYFGPWIAGALAVLLAFTQSPILAVFVGILYLIIQQLENNIIVPKVLGKSVGLNPLIVIIAILIGFKLAGMVGGLLSVPIAAALSVFITDFLDKKV